MKSLMPERRDFEKTGKGSGFRPEKCGNLTEDRTTKGKTTNERRRK